MCRCCGDAIGNSNGWSVWSHCDRRNSWYYRILLSLLIAASTTLSNGFQSIGGSPLPVSSVSSSSRIYSSSSSSSSSSSNANSMVDTWLDSDNDIDSTQFVYLERVRQGLLEAGYMDEWNEAVQLLVRQSAGSTGSRYSIDRASDILARTWRWKPWAIVTSPTARRFLPTPEAPNATRIAESLDWLYHSGPLATFSSSSESTTSENTSAALLRMVHTLLMECPRSYLLQPANSYRTVLHHVAPAPYAVSAAAAASSLDATKSKSLEAFLTLILQSPQVLCATLHCAETGCQSECGTCWVSLARA